MGHSEMLLAVAGLDADKIQTKTTILASGDWSSLPVSEQIALRFASRLTLEPGSLTGNEVRVLIDTFGSDRALDIVWYVSWCNYMTRIADAFNLPLETTNVFAELQQKRTQAQATPGK